MDPFSAMLGGAASITGALMNTSSAQAINAANLQFATQTQQGANLPAYFKNLVSGAEQQGINKLAALGIHSPGGGGAPLSATSPGSGLQSFGNILSRMDLEAHQLDIQTKKENLQREAALTKQTNIDNAIRMRTLADLESGRTISGPQPASDTSITGATIQGGKDFLNSLPSSYNDWSNRVRNSWTGAPFMKWYDDFMSNK